MKHPHILCDRNDVSEMVILPGDPGRVLRVAKFLDDWEEVAFNREYRTIKGHYKSMPITVTSTGIGGPSAAIAMEELISCGAKYFIRIGSSGAVQSHIKIGDLIIPSAAVREEGASKMYVSENFPAVADFELMKTVVSVAQEMNYKIHVGIVRSHDAFYINEEKALMNHWREKGVLGSDMETATLMIISQLRHVKFASILNTVVELEGDIKEDVGRYVASDHNATEGERREIEVALESLYVLSQTQTKG